MKRNLLAVSAVVIAIVFSSFSGKRLTDVYFVLKATATADHTLRTNYDETTTSQSTFLGGANLKWIMIRDDNGTVSSGEFSTMYDELDRTIPQNTTLTDDTEGTVVAGGITYKLEKAGF